LISTYCQKWDPGNESIHCESLINYCNTIACKCTEVYFSIRCCELKRSLLASKHRFNRLFAYTIILIMVFVPGIIILTDMLKYGSNTDPAEKEQQQQ
jgi:hypothetical protein